MRTSGRYVRLDGVWHRRAGYVGNRSVPWPEGRSHTEVIGVYPPETGRYAYALAADVEEEVSIESTVRYAGLRWDVVGFLAQPTRLASIDDLEAGRITRTVEPREPEVWIELTYDGPEYARYGAVAGARTQSRFEAWPGRVDLIVPLADVDDPRETVSPA